MKPSYAFFVATLSFFTATAAAQDPAAPDSKIKELREKIHRAEADIHRLEAELAGLTASLNDLKAILATTDARQPAANRPVPPPPLRFSAGIERAMLGEAIQRTGIKSPRDNELFDDNELRPRRPAPAIPPRK